MASSKEAADLKIKFIPGDFGNAHRFSNNIHALGQAFHPPSREILFHDDAHFTNVYENDDGQYTLRLVATHIIGHALGLSHSLESESIMFPLYQQFPSNFNLSMDDQEAIQALYGKPKTTTSARKQAVTQKPTTYSQDDSNSGALPKENWCSRNFQTGCEGPDGELYLFRDDQVWRYRARTKRLWDLTPKSIGETFSRLNDSTITACAQSTSGYTYFFRDFRFWKVKTHWSVDGPRIVPSKHLPQNPRLALLHQNSIYLIHDGLAYRFNEHDLDRKLEIKRLDSILQPPPSEQIQAGFTYAKRHYLFTEYNVYVYDSSNGNLISGYPKAKINGWFACEELPLQNEIKKSKTTKTTTAQTTRKNKVAVNEESEEDNDHQHHHWRKRPFFSPIRAEHRRRWEG